MLKEYILEIVSAFMVLFAVINVFGAVPVILKFKEEGTVIQPLKITVFSFSILFIFLFAGKLLLSLFGVDISSFAIAGSFVIFILSCEMIFGFRVMKFETSSSASYVPIAFPLIAGAGSITTLISLRAEYSILSILIGLGLNMIVVYVVLHLIDPIGKLLGETGIHILKRIFGIILLAIAVKLFLSNTGIEIIK